jgi:glycogen debranching enzyme
VIKEDRWFAVAGRDGSMRPQAIDGNGVWFGDLRMLSEYRLLIGGQEPKVNTVRWDDGWADFGLLLGGLEIDRMRYMEGGLHERLTITNPGAASVSTDLELVFAADFADMLVVRGIVQLPPRPPAASAVTERGLIFKVDERTHRTTEVVLRPAGTRHRLELQPGETFTLVVDVAHPASDHGFDFDAGLSRNRDSYRDWSRECAHFETDNPGLNELLRQSREDMRMLCDRYPTGIYPTAGLPWFAVPFGRDALFCSLQALPVNPHIARGALRFLAAHQGRREDQDSEEQPGKILHEVRTGEVIELGVWPHILYGTIDATPLFLTVLAETLDWTDDTGLYEELWPAAEAALDWCYRYGDSDGDGYIEYHGARARNQGWKDSDDSFTHADGTPAPNPAALCEVQAYLYRGLLSMGRRRPELKARAAELRKRFNRDFWIARERFVAQGLDGNKRRVEAITSNPGHCLWAEILPPGRARDVARRLVSPELFSGWGIRTLSTRAVNYDACSYHNGSVWPHDNAIAAEGLRKAGFTAEAEQVARAVLEAGMEFPDLRLPELWCGHDREPGHSPNDYRNSCSPQNWAAGSSFQLLAMLLGLDADARLGRLRIAPVETKLWRRLEVTGLHFGGHRIDFSVDGTRVKLGRLPRGVKVSTK